MKKEILIISLVCFIIVQIAVTFAQPIGTDTIVGPSSRRADNGTSSNLTAQGGNVTLITADLSQTSTLWQGFYGDVQGGIILSDAAGDTFYDWSVIEAVGEIIASRTTVTDWSSINCTNQTELYLEEESLNITNSSSEGINDTFQSTSHPSFTIGSNTLTGCRSTRTYNSTTSQSVFWNVLLNTASNNTVYTVLMEDNTVGFNGTTYDFQMLVPVSASSGVATYYMYAELGS